jgi:hypothetical protein
MGPFGLVRLDRVIGWLSPHMSFVCVVGRDTGKYVDKKCPFTGNVSIRGRILSGVVKVREAVCVC